MPQLDFDILLAFSIGKPREFLYSHPEHPVSIIQYLRFRWFIHRYKKGYSVAAITKHKEFYGLDFFVNKHTLIPRPDTELMVAEATGIMNYELRIKDTNITYIDVGTGSGCVPIAILCHCEERNDEAIPKFGGNDNGIATPRKSGARNDIHVYASDISRAALRVAKKNAKIHGVKINFFHGNLLQPLIHNSKFIIHNSNVIITANLPYLTEQQFQSEPSIQREPKKALVAKNNGLALYEELLQQISKLLIANCSLLIFLEIDPSQTEEISKLIKQYLPESTFEIKKDLGGLDRLVKISI